MIDTTSGEYDFTYLSLGAGVQSSALLVLCCTDDRLPKPDVAVFADTGDEPPWVYEFLGALTEWSEGHGVPVHIAQRGVLSEEVVARHAEGKSFVSVPIYTSSDRREGMLRRQCTREFKVEPIVQEVRQILGYGHRRRVKEKVRAMIGISIDEVQRMKPSFYKWLTNTWPLVDLGIHRRDCSEIVTRAGLPEPSKSACVYCPYHSDQYWQWMKDTHPDQFGRAVSFDHAIRNMTKKGEERHGYVHYSCVPLDEAVFDVNDPFQVDMFAECEGMCGV